MKELGKCHLYVLPAAAEKGLRCLHLRAEQRSEQKVLEHLLKQPARGHTQSSKQMGVRRATSQKMLVQLSVLVTHYLPSTPSKLATTLDCSFTGCFEVTLAPRVVIQEIDT